VPSLVVPPGADRALARHTSVPTLGRQALLKGAFAAAALGSLPLTTTAAEPFSGAYAKVGGGPLSDRPNNLGSAGISAYEKMKIETALTDLADARSAANDPKLAVTIDSFTKAVKAVKDSALDNVDSASLTAASSQLAAIATGSERFEGQAASIDKRGSSLLAAIKKRDAGAAAGAAIKLTDELADFGFAWANSERPLQVKTEGSIPLNPMNIGK